MNALRSKTLILGLIPLLILGFLISVPTVPGTGWDLTVPYVAQGQGPTFNTLGTVKDPSDQAEGDTSDGVEVIQIVGTGQYPTTGQLNMTTVAVRPNLTLSAAITLWATGKETLLPTDRVIPPNVSEEEFQQANAAAFMESESNATLAAMRFLDKPVQLIVQSVDENSPAADVVNPGDIIESVNGVSVQTPQDFVEQVEKVKANSGTDDRGNSSEPSAASVTVGVKSGQDSAVRPVSVELSDSAIDIGFAVVVQPADGSRIIYNLEDVGGPSAGLMFTLAVIDKLTPGQLTAGKFIAGTGSVDSAGVVGEIGGVSHKIAAAVDAGATVFLVPEGNCAEAVKSPPEGIDLISVKSVNGAVEALNAYNAGSDQVPMCKA